MVTTSPVTPVDKIFGFTYTDSAGLRRCHAALYPKQEEAEAAVANTVVTKPPGFMTNVEFFVVKF